VTPEQDVTVDAFDRAAGVLTEAAAPGAAPETPPDDPSRKLVPAWLAAVVIVLLLAVLAVGGYILSTFVLRNAEYQTPLGREIARWEQVLAQKPDDVDAHVALGFAYQQEQRYDDALVQYDLVLKYDPANTAALYNIGMVLFELDRPEEAEERLLQVLETDDTHLLAAKALGEYYAERGDYRAVVAVVRPAAEAQESAADLQYLMGLAYERLGRDDWARERYEAALTFVPDMADALEGLERTGPADE